MFQSDEIETLELRKLIWLRLEKVILGTDKAAYIIFKAGIFSRGGFLIALRECDL